MISVNINTIHRLKKIIGRRQVEFSIPEQSRLSDLISIMAETWGEALSCQLFEPGTQNLDSHLRLMVNGRDVVFLDGLDTVLQDGDEIYLLPPAFGG